MSAPSIPPKSPPFAVSLAERLKRHWRALLAVVIAGMVFLQIFAFSPSRLEQDQPPEPVHQSELVPGSGPAKLPFVSQIPKDVVPDYTIDGFQYVSAQGGRKQWKVNSAKAYFYTKQGYVISTEVKSELFDSEGKATVVSSLESKYRLDRQDLELFGDVVAVAPDGMRMEAPYMMYEAKSRDILIPPKYPVRGLTAMSPQKEQVEFFSSGLGYDAKTGLLRLPQSVRTIATRKVSGKPDEKTTIVSDRAELDRAAGRITYSMLDSRPNESRFVVVDQPGLRSRSRRVEFLSRPAGASSGAGQKRGFQNMRAIEDVRIDETAKPVSEEDKMNPRLRTAPEPRRATAGVAEFIPDRNLIVLREFPQVYQGKDTVTGEVILVHRDSDVVEVEQSNAYSEGEMQKK